MAVRQPSLETVMFPIRDENPTVRNPLATLAIIAINLAAWIFVQGLGSEINLAQSLCSYGLIPGDLPIWLPSAPSSPWVTASAASWRRVPSSRS